MKTGKVAVMMSADSLTDGRRVLKALLEKGVDAEEFDPAKRPLQELKNQFQMVFVVLWGPGGEDGTVQGVLEWMGVPYTGNGVLGTSVSWDKVKSKAIWVGEGLPTARHLVLNKVSYHEKNDDKALQELGLPMMVKPAQDGDSRGISMVESREALGEAIKKAFDCGDTILVEQFIQGREFSVPILNDEALPPVEIKLNGGRSYYSMEAKDDHSLRDFICPADLTHDQDQQIRKVAMDAFLATGCTHYGRVDMIMDHQDKLYLLEVNSIPVMCPYYSLMGVGGKGAGLTFNKLVLEILKGAALKANFPSFGAG